MDRMEELAARCEAATGLDTLLNCLIENATGLAKFKRDDCIGYGDAGYSRVQPKPFTASLDAAMTLYVSVPERVPSNPRMAAAEALRQRAEAA